MLMERMAMGEAGGSRVHVAGNAVVDVLLRDVSPDALRPVDGWTAGNVHFLKGPPDCVLGGNGASVAYALGRLGERVSLNSRVADDAFGQMVKGWLGSANVELAGPEATHTAVNIIFLGKDGTRRSVYYTGDPVAWRESLGVREATWFYASGYGQVGCEDLEALIEVFQASRSRGVNVAFDPGPWFFGAATHEQMLRAWRWTNCLIGTESELGTWLTYSGVEDLIHQILLEGPEHVVVKRGEKGAAFGSCGDRVALMRTEGVSGANTVGGGDTFNGGVIHGLCNSATLEASVRLGLELSTRAVRRGRGVLGAFEDS